MDFDFKRLCIFGACRSLEVTLALLETIKINDAPNLGHEEGVVGTAMLH